MSEFEDRQDATRAIDTPATGATAPIATAPDSVPEGTAAETAELGAEGADDREALAAVEGNRGVPDEEAEGEAQSGDETMSSFPVAATHPEASDAAVDDSEPPLLDDVLEDGIAAVFAALHRAARDGEAGESDEAAGPLSDDQASDGITFRLLGELDRLWHRAA